jgi:hypothetical protein
MGLLGWISGVGFAALTCAMLFARQATGSGVGTKPGSFDRVKDILAAAKERGHDLALFGAG